MISSIIDHVMYSSHIFSFANRLFMFNREKEYTKELSKFDEVRRGLEGFLSVMSNSNFVLDTS